MISNQFRNNTRVEPYSKAAVKKIRYPTTVFLRRDNPKPRIWACNNCQNILFKYFGGQAEMIVAGNADEGPNGRILSFPIIIFCKNGPCDMTYIFEAWVLPADAS